MTIVTESAPIEIEEEGVEFTSELFDCNQEEHSPDVSQMSSNVSVESSELLSDDLS
jgi:hypothetical protein